MKGQWCGWAGVVADLYIISNETCKRKDIHWLLKWVKRSFGGLTVHQWTIYIACDSIVNTSRSEIVCKRD